ncbi:hypothetical protein FACS1894105_11370 [Clostridia bacterium]|nr:hypothetical protein FACS1894105_11370 [Clostridia bacterium]
MADPKIEMHQFGSGSVQIGQISGGDITLNVYSESQSVVDNESCAKTPDKVNELSDIDEALSKERALEAMAEKILDYMCQCMNRTFTEQGKITHTAKIIDLIQRGISFEQIVRGITEAKGIYLKFDENGATSDVSANSFLEKYSGLIVNKSKPPIEQKISHLCNVARQGVDDWRQNEAKIVLKNYVTALRNKNWSDDSIIEDLTIEVMPICRDAYSWAWWRNKINKWIDDINHW